MEAPDIIWIVTTQWRAQATGYAGDANARTPWIDGLASEAVNYRMAVTPHPMGPQARAALLSGRLCPENGVRDYFDPLPARTRTIAHALGGQGYATAYFGKWHLSRRDPAAPLVGDAHARQLVPPENRGGFGHWEGFESGFLLNDPWLHGSALPLPVHFKGYQSDILCERAAAWLREPRSRPAFCVISMEAPHPPYEALAPHIRPMTPAAVQLRGNVPLGGAVEAKARAELSGYYAHIEATDRAIGRLIAEVDLSETIVVFTSVHGDMHGAHGLFRKAWPHEESVRVPLLVRHPRAGAVGVNDDSPVSLADLPRMCVAWAANRDWRCRRDAAAIGMPAPTPIAHQCPHAWRGFRSVRHKLVFRRHDGGREEPWLYFDLERDPLELHNLALDPSRQREMAELARFL